jgi:hypothetical protein
MKDSNTKKPQYPKSFIDAQAEAQAQIDEARKEYDKRTLWWILRMKNYPPAYVSSVLLQPKKQTPKSNWQSEGF